MAGGLWEESLGLYAAHGGKPRENQLDWRFPSGASIRFENLDSNTYKSVYQGGQFALMGFDELTHFTEEQFFYLLSRNRSASGARPYVRATCNPDAASWVKDFIKPWLSGEAKDGELRWMLRRDGVVQWVPEGTPEAKSVTFISAKLSDNRILMEKDPGYLANLLSLSSLDRRRLLEGDWDVVESGNLFKRDWFNKTLDERPVLDDYVRFFDLATSVKESADFTAGALVGLDHNSLIIGDVAHFRAEWPDAKKRIRAIVEADLAWLESITTDEVRNAHRDYGVPVPSYTVGIEVFGMQLALFQDLARNELGDLNVGVQACKPVGDKRQKASIWAARAENGLVSVVKGAWNNAFIAECIAFTGEPGKGHDDQVDAVSGAVDLLYYRRGGRTETPLPLAPGSIAAMKAYMQHMGIGEDDEEEGE